MSMFGDIERKAKDYCSIGMPPLCPKISLSLSFNSMFDFLCMSALHIIQSDLQGALLNRSSITLTSADRTPNESSLMY